MQGSMTRGAQAYQVTAVQSRSPIELVVMLYDGALRFLALAGEAADRGDVAARRDAMSRAMAIIAELQNTLNVQAGGEVAASLDQLYSYLSARLLDVAVKGDRTAIDEALKLLRPLREAWAQVATAPPAPPQDAR